MTVVAGIDGSVEVVPNQFDFIRQWDDPAGIRVAASVMFGQGTVAEGGDARGAFLTSPRDTVWAVPRLDIAFRGGMEYESGVAEACAQVQAAALDAHELHNPTATLPLHVEPSKRASFRLDGAELVVNAGILQGVPLEMEDPFAEFLRLTDTLGVVVAATSRQYIATLHPSSAAEMLPCMAVHPGGLSQKGFDRVKQRSSNWKAVVPVNVSLMAGGEDLSDDHVMTYGSTAQERFLPTGLSYSGTCILCGGTRVSVEHCTPSWLTEMLGVMPTTAPLLCVACNHRLGRNIEEPVAGLYHAGRLLDPANKQLMALWMFKTALMLSAAANVQIPVDLRESLARCEVRRDLLIDATEDASGQIAGYRFTVTHFRRSLRQQGAFLFSFVGGSLRYYVARPPEGAPLSVVRYRGQPFHDALVESIAGARMYRTDAEPRPAPPRTPKKR